MVRSARGAVNERGGCGRAALAAVTNLIRRHDFQRIRKRDDWTFSARPNPKESDARVSWLRGTNRGLWVMRAIFALGQEHSRRKTPKEGGEQALANRSVSLRLPTRRGQKADTDV